MGSLMAGWDSFVSDPKSVKFERNRSLTKAEIETYWKSKNQKEEHMGHISNLSHDNQENMVVESEKRYQRSNSLPLVDTKENLLDMETEDGMEKLKQTNGWWMRSNWAFLNEPPVIETEGSGNKYVSQHHIAVVDSSKSPS